MQVLHGLQDVRPETAVRLPRGRGKRHLVHQQRAAGRQDGEVGVAGQLARRQGDVELLPRRARDAERLLPQDAPVPDQRDGQPGVALGIDRAHERLAGHHVLRSLGDARGLRPGGDLLGIVHIDGVTLHKTVAAFTESRPFRGDVGNPDILRKTFEQDLLPVGGSHADVLVKGFRIVLPQGNRILRTAVGDLAGKHLLAVPPHAYALAAAADFQMMPGLLVQLDRLRRLRGQRLQRDDLPGPGAEGHLFLLPDKKGELGAVHGFLRLGERLRLVVRLDLGLGLCQGEPLSFVGRVIEAQVVGIRSVCQVLEGEA